MNHLKSYAVKNGCDALVTYADNDAVGYFRKQGFVDDLKLPPERLGVVKVRLCLGPDVSHFMSSCTRAG